MGPLNGPIAGLVEGDTFFRTQRLLQAYTVLQMRLQTEPGAIGDFLCIKTHLLVPKAHISGHF